MDRLAGLDHELRQEMATSLGRVAEKLERLIGRCAQLGAAADAASPGERPAILAEHEAARREADLYLWYLIVQREAIGMRDHRQVQELYPIPSRLR